MLYSGLIPLLCENGALGLVPILALCLLVLSATLPPPSRIASSHGASHMNGIPDTAAALFGLLFLLFLSVFYNYTEIPTIVAVCSLNATLALFRSKP
jgi:hypothetical protein